MTEQEDMLLVDRLASQLREKIERGDYGVDGLIPSMSELGTMFGKTSRAAVADVIMLLRAQGYIVQTAKRRFRVVNPKIELQGLTPNFKDHLIALGLTPEENDIETPRIEIMPLDVAKMFIRDDTKEPAIQAGLHVIHRVRRQGIAGLPMRIGHIWYPATIAREYLEAMQLDSSFDTLAALKRDHGIVIAEESFSLHARIPADAQEMKELNVARFQPLLEVRRICYTANRELVVTLHRTILDATRFSYSFSRDTHWK